VDPGDLQVTVELGTGEAIVSAVEGGLGVAILSRYVASKAIELGTVVELDVAGFPVGRPFFAVTCKTGVSKAAEAFRQHLLEAFAGASGA